MRRKRLGILEHNTVDGRRQNNIPDIYSDYDGFGQEKYLTQFQQLILIVMIKKGTDISEEILLQESMQQNTQNSSNLNNS